MKIKFTKSAVERLPLPDKGYKLHWDTQIPGFGVRVTAGGAKTFVLQQRINGRDDKRMTIGRFGKVTAEQARKLAQKLSGEIAAGEDAIKKKGQKRLAYTTLNDAFMNYLKVKKNLKPRTVRDMREAMRGLKDWWNRPLIAITGDMVVKRHIELGARSHARANLTMRYLRAIFNFATAQYEDAEGNTLITKNPVNKLNKTKAWFSVERRKTVIKPHQLRPWMRAVLELENRDWPRPGTRETARDYLLTLLLTGLRKGEALKLTWANVDFEARTLTALDTKNHTDHTLPLSDYLLELLQYRHAKRESHYVFPDATGNAPIRAVQKAVKLVSDASGVEFCLHDLRRTFATVADSLDISGYAVKALLNHKPGSKDVTAGYIVTDMERLRKPMQRITDYLLKAGGVYDSAEVVPLRTSAS